MDIHHYSGMTQYQQKNGHTSLLRYDTVPAKEWTYIAIQVRHRTSREMDAHRYSGKVRYSTSREMDVLCYSGMAQYQQRNGQTSLFRYDTEPAEKWTYIAI
ncbi:hypothetical protein DPMN_089024 [Dreissena polymorpha]|uniref:Uncharacterized protein n=1 Tax=Dreissena polymorpha TaxID=45954 RepID=A0A9D4QXU1_DREPO|nr:hypothetical protein DPMN_089024 [Dreissena polymorpha]